MEHKDTEDHVTEGDADSAPPDTAATSGSPADADGPGRVFPTDKYRDALARARMLRASRGPEDAAVEDEDMETGRAFGQWVLAVRCECGRRWFEVRETYRVRCPRCGKVAYLEVELTEEE